MYKLSCKETKIPKNANEQAIEEAKLKMQDGDLVLRLEDDFISRLLADLSPKERKYSHAGIVKKIGNDISVYNIMPSSVKNLQDDSIKLTPLDSFINPKKHELFGLYRYQLTNAEKQNFITNIEAYRSSKVKFDLKFNYATDNEMYIY
jgi:hypothetical protein